MRLIDADAIKYKMLYKEDWLKGTGVEKQGVWKEDIDSMPTIDAEHRWIPCSERMPKDEDYHMLYGYYEGVVYWCTDKGVVGFGWYYESTKQWADQNDEWHDRYGEVIAWMPLPKPYEVNHE